MSDVEAVSASPTCGVPLIVGAPAAAVFGSGSSAGPATVAEGLLLSCRRSAVQMPPSVQARFA